MEMNEASRKAPAEGSKLLVVGMTLLGVLKMVDFLFYGRQWFDLVSAIGFSLMAYGIYKNGGRGKPRPPVEPSFDQMAHYALISGLALSVLSFAARHWP